jgi:general stress protein 26
MKERNTTMKNYEEALSLMTERFGLDTLLSVATVDGNRPNVRIVDAYYEDGAFYVVTYTLSGKMQQIEKNPAVGVCGEWFTAHGIGENLGHVLLPQNAEMMAKLHSAFAAWYDNGHTDESDPNTVLLRIRLTDGILFHNGTKYNIDFQDK